jgi:hypothetical protein
MKRVLNLNNWHVSMTTFNDDATVVKTELVPGKRYEFHDSPAELTARLQSTRAGNAAWWLCGSNATRALNESPYNPVLRAHCTVFEWKPPASKDNRRLFYYETPSQEELESAYHGNYVIQGGSNVINWFAVVTDPIPDPLREKIVQLLDFVSPLWPQAHRQGHLEVLGIVLGEDNQLWQELVRMLPGAGSGFRVLYNHYIYPLYQFAWRVIDGVAYSVFVPSGDVVYVTSEDHENDGLVIKAMQLCVARHPIPRPQRGVD